MKFRILEKSVYNSWYDMWEIKYFVQSKIPYTFFWQTHYIRNELDSAEILMDQLSRKYLTNKGFKKSRKVLKEFEV